MRKLWILAVVASMLPFFLGGCSETSPEGTGSTTPSTEAANRTEGDLDTGWNFLQTGFTEAVPADYRAASPEPGSVVRVEYESRDYAGDDSEIAKAAYVYLAASCASSTSRTTTQATIARSRRRRTCTCPSATTKPTRRCVTTSST